MVALAMYCSMICIVKFEFLLAPVINVVVTHSSFDFVKLRLSRFSQSDSTWNEHLKC